MPLSSACIDQIRQSFEDCTDPLSLHEVPIEFPFDLLDALAKSSVSPLLYFSTPNQEVEQVGAGQWASFNNAEAAHFLEENKGKDIQLFGGNAFQGGDDHQKMPCEHWVLPMIVLSKKGNQWSCRVIFDKRNGNLWAMLEIALNELFNPLKNQPCHYPLFCNLIHRPNKKQWIENIEKLKSAFRTKVVEKVVLARKTTVNFQETVNPFQMVKAIQRNDPHLYHFVYRFSDKYAFIGGTPERLFEMSGNHLESEAIAGTVRNEDYTDGFLFQEKESLEHQYVSDFLLSAFDQLCKNVVTEPPRVLKLKYLSHLIQPFKGVVKQGCPIRVLLTLHPTPAVAGTPSEVAVSFINQC